jgi:hypothetical protein
MSQLSRWQPGLLAAVLGVFGITLILTGDHSPEAPVQAGSNSNVLGIVAEPQSLSLSKGDANGDVMALYTLRNSGRRIVNVVGITTTCACSLAEPLNDPAIRPGESRTLRVTGTPPQFGAAEVTVKVALNDDTEAKVLNLGLRLVGQQVSEERISQMPRDLDLLSYRSEVVKREFEILTTELDDKVAWINALKCDDDTLTVRIQNVESTRRPAGGLSRRYLCEVAGGIPETPGEWRSAAIYPVFTREQPQRPSTIHVSLNRLPRWTVHPAVLVIDLAAPAASRREIVLSSEEDIDVHSTLSVASCPRGLQADILPGNTEQELRLLVTVDRTNFSAVAKDAVELVLDDQHSEDKIRIPVFFNHSVAGE